MRLYSGHFAQALRRHALVAIRAHPDLKREYRLRRQRVFMPAIRVLLVCLVVALSAFLFNMSVTANRPEFPYIFIAVYGTGTVVLRSAALFDRLRRGLDLAVFSGLPIEDAVFFRLQCNRFLLNSSWVFVVALIAYGSHSLQKTGSLDYALWPSLLCALAQWAGVVALALALYDVDKKLLSRVAVAMYGLIPMTAYLPSTFAARLLPFTLYVPAGWINKAHTLLLEHNGVGFLWLLPTVLMAVFCLILLPRVRSSFRIQPLENINTLSLGADGEVPAAEGQSETQVLPVVPEAAAVRVRSELSLTPDWKTRGWLERISALLLDPDEKAIAGFMTGEQLGQWSSSWLKAFYLSAAYITLAGLVPGVPLWVDAVALIGSALLAAPLLGGAWLGFASLRLGTKASFVAAFYPLSYWRVSKVIFKINVVRLLAWSVLFLPSLIVFCRRLDMELQKGEILGLRLISLALIMQLPLILALHSKGTNDTRTFSLHGAILFTLTIAYIGAVVGGLFVLFIPDLPYGWIGGVLILTPTSVLVWWLYGRFYSRGRVDLMHDPKQS